MAVTVADVSDPLATKLVIDPTTDTNSNAAEDNVTGASGIMYYVQIDNKNNAAATYVKVVNYTAATPSTTISDWVFYAAASTKTSYVIETGVAFSSGLSFWGTSTAANGTAQTDPGNPVVTKILTT
tara:strand:+ start:422 stop:799 length:378 start_codon:yes stop_codon:yes gene_type:complete